MNACTNCYNGCTSVTSDQCVKYTGSDITLLGIESGDSLAVVEQKIIEYLSDAIDGSGIFPTIEDSYICSLVAAYLPCPPGCTTITLNDILTAIIRSVCAIQVALTALTAQVATIDGDFTLPTCLSGDVAVDAGIHAVVQAVINEICDLSDTLDVFTIYVNTQVVTKTELPTLIDAYLATKTTSTYVCDKMVPYVAYPYFGSIATNFGPTGVGLGLWAGIYLCNGLNGTPDMRGVSPVGDTDMASGGAALDPVATGAVYSMGFAYGARTVTLGLTQIPSHTHAHTIAASQAAHTHFTARDGASNAVLSSTTPIKEEHDPGMPTWGYELKGTSGIADIGLTNSATPAITVTGTITNAGGGLSHDNVTPSRACYFIMYIP